MSPISRVWRASLLVGVAAITAPAAVLHAQEVGTIAGTVVASGSGTPLVGVTVFVEGGGSTVTGAEGRFQLSGVSVGERTLVVERIGYESASRTVQVVGGQSASVRLELSAQAIAIPRILVSGTREARLIGETAASVGIIGRGDLEAVAPTHPSEIMGRVPGVWVNVTGGEGHMTAIRQPLSTDPLYLYLENGVPTRSTGFFNHNALYEINLPAADRIEVVKGPGSALYGSDALGGIVNVQTRAPGAAPERELSLETGGHGFGRLRAALGTPTTGGGVRADLNYTRTDGWRAGTGYDRWSGSARWDRDFGGGLTVRSMASYSTIDQSTAGSSALSRDDYETRPTVNYTPISWRKVSALRISSAIEKRTARGALSVTPYFRSNSMDILPNWSLTFDPAIWETSNLSVGVLTKYRRDLPSMDGEFITGIDLDYSPGSHFEKTIVPNRVDGIFTTYADGPAIYDYDVSFRQASPYAHVELSPAERLRLTLGARLDFMGYNYTNLLSVEETGNHRRPADASPSFSAVTPKLGMTYQLAEATSVFAAVRMGFRSPSEGQLFRQGSAENTVNLEPVKVTSYETGVRGGLGSRVRYDLSAYHMIKKDDILGFQLGDGRTENVNAGETRHRGVELGLGVLFGRGVQLDVAYSLQESVYEEWSPRANLDYSGQEMNSAPGTIGNAELSWVPVAIPNARFAVNWSHLGAYFLDPENEQEYEGHDLIGARGSYELGDRFVFFLKVSNVSDERYAETASYNAFRGQELAPGLPRTFYFGMEIR